MIKLSHPRNIESLELCLRDLYTWLTANKLKINSSKTELLQITPLNKPPVDLSLTVNGNIIKCSDKVKDLGALLDSNLTIVDNIQSVTRKAYCALANRGKIRRDLTRPAAETLVNACVTSVMDYANSTSLGVPQVHTNNIQRLQNMAARIICRCGPRDLVTPLRKELQYVSPHFYLISLMVQEIMKLEIRHFNFQFIFLSISQQLVDTS